MHYGSGRTEVFCAKAVKTLLLLLKLMIFLQINSFTVYLEKYCKTLSLLFYFFKIPGFFDRTPLFVSAKYWYCRNLGTWQKSQHSPRNKLNMAMLLIINVSRSVQFLFFYITRTKFRVSFQSQNSHHRASQISMTSRIPKSIFHFINIISILATSDFQ